MKPDTTHQFRLGSISSPDQLEELWAIDNTAYGAASITYEKFLDWWRAYPPGYDSNDLLLATNNNGAWSRATLVTGPQASKTTPAICYTTNGLLLAYVANNDTNNLLVTIGAEGTWSSPTQVSGANSAAQSGKMAPSVAALASGGGAIVLAYVANNDSNDLLVTTSTDGGITWSPSMQVKGPQSSKMAPALFWLGGNTLILAYVANNPSNDLLVTTSTDGGTTWAAAEQVYGPQSSKDDACSPGLLATQSINTGSPSRRLQKGRLKTPWGMGGRKAHLKNLKIKCTD